MQDNRHPIEIIDFNVHNQALVIEASAGTGKTWTIERLFVKALLSRTELELKHFLVITFTKDATSELKYRILNFVQQTLQQLTTLSAQAQPQSNDIFIQQILKLNLDLGKCIRILNSTIQNFDQAAIYTIHGLYHRILTQYQFEMNIFANFKLNEYKHTIITELVRNFFRQHILSQHEFIHHAPTVYDNLSQIIRSGNNASKDYVATIAHLLYKHKLIDYTHGKFTLAYNLVAEPNLALLQQPIDTTSNKKAAKAQNQALVEEMRLHLLSAIAIYVSQHFHDASSYKNTLDFNDIIAILADELTHNSKLATEIYQDYPIVFIDEFQDTDIQQWHILRHIYRLASTQQRGCMITVGDPKQAIYKFRGADINAYIQAKITINNTLNLQHNYRSHTHIVNFINQLFSAKDNQQCFGNKIDFHTTLAMAENSTLALPNARQITTLLSTKNLPLNYVSDAHVHIVTIQAKDAPSRNTQLLYALAYDILLLLQCEPKLVKNMAILVTKNDEAIAVKKTLSAYGIPLTLHKKENIFATSEARDLLILFEALVNLANSSQLRLLLASNLLNIPYHDLHNFIDISSQIFSPYTWLECLVKYQQLLNRGSQLLSMIYLLISDLQQLQAFYNNKLHNQTVTNLLHLGEIMQAHCQHMASLHEIIFWLKQKIDSTNNQQYITSASDELDNELVRLDTHETQIPIITQHKSKGLEFDIVFCPFFKDDVYSISALKKLATNAHADNTNKVEFMQLILPDGTREHTLSNDNEKIAQIREEDNLETQRLNYVGLTRAKTRLYLYLTNMTVSNGNYWATQHPPLIQKLFGLNPLDIEDNSHALFDYRALFSNPELSIKQPQLLPGVTVYSRNNINHNILQQLSIAPVDTLATPASSSQYTTPPTICQAFSRQSYSSLTRIKNDEAENIIDKLAEAEFATQPVTALSYNYNVLNQLKGAEFGILLHSMCEQYPLTTDYIRTLHQHALLSGYSADLRTQYIDELTKIVDNIFTYSILPNYSLTSIANKCYEFEFNLKVTNSCSIDKEIHALFAQYYGIHHPYTKACSKLDIVSSGFLTGFIDVFFSCENKYYILDYKTNSLSDYQSSHQPITNCNTLVIESARNFYHIQYVLYLVAIKRHLQQKLSIADATSLLGGSIYFYIRGLFVTDTNPSGILFDNQCLELVAQLERMFC